MQCQALRGVCNAWHWLLILFALSSARRRLNRRQRAR